MLPPSSPLDVVILPGLAVFFGMLLYGLALRQELLGNRVRWKWLPIAVLALGAIAGFGPFWNYIGSSSDAELYRGSIPGRKMLIAHYSAFLLPLLCIAGTLLYDLWRRRRQVRED